MIPSSLRGLRDNSRFLLSLAIVAAALLLMSLVRNSGFDGAALCLAIGMCLYLLRGRPLLLLVTPVAIAPLAWGLLAFLGIIPFSPVLAGEFLIGAGAAIFAGRRLRLERLAEERSMSLLQARVLELREMSFRDPLTGLYNRRYASEVGRGFVAQYRRYGNDLHAVMADIDHFKRINDELGHARGDEVLKVVAAILRTAIRETDVASRIGGEEFLVLLPKAGAESAQNIANRIRDIVGSTNFEGINWKVTVSLGVTGIRESDELESLVERADSFLYQSKRSGRNRVSGS